MYIKCLKKQSKKKTARPNFHMLIHESYVYMFNYLYSFEYLKLELTLPKYYYVALLIFKGNGRDKHTFIINFLRNKFHEHIQCFFKNSLHFIWNVT